MHRMKTKASRPDASGSSSSEEDISFGDSQEEEPTPLVPSTDAASSNAVSHRKSGAFAVESIFPQVRGTMEGRSFNVSLLRF